MKEILASLVFDSWLEPIPELRASLLEDRHLIYEGGGVILDLLLKKQDKGTCIHIGGRSFLKMTSLPASAMSRCLWNRERIGLARIRTRWVNLRSMQCRTVR